MSATIPAATATVADTTTITISASSLWQAMADASIFASPDTIRATLHSVAVHVKDGTVTVEATDSYQLVVCQVHESTRAFGPDRTILVDLADVKRAVTMLKPLVKGNPFVSLTSDGHNVTVTSPTGESMACPDTAWHGNQWPNTAMLLAPYVGYAKGDASRSGTARIGLSPKLMARFAKLSAVRSTETPLRVELTDDLKPVMVFYEPTDDAWDNRQVLWMPVRLAG